MPRLRLLARQLVRHAVAALAAGQLLSGCGDDADPFESGRRGNDGERSGDGGSATGGSAVGGSGSPSAGSSGSSSSGGGGMPMAGGGGSTAGGESKAGSGGSMAGATGSAGTGTAGDGGTGGDNGMGGEGGGGQGGIGPGGEGGGGQGGVGGAPDAVCTSENLGIAVVSATPPQLHDHLPIDGAFRTTLLDIINTTMPLTFTLPVEGSNPHDHTLTFTPEELTALRNGGSVAMITSSTGGPSGNLHTHTYSIECAP